MSFDSSILPKILCTCKGFSFLPQPLLTCLSGSVKSNLGHLEGASGIASVIKAIMMLERGFILPNADFQRLNPSIDAEFLRLKVSSWSGENFNHCD